jgi:hypothetical protein
VGSRAIACPAASAPTRQRADQPPFVPWPVAVGRPQAHPRETRAQRLRHPLAPPHCAPLPARQHPRQRCHANRLMLLVALESSARSAALACRRRPGQLYIDALRMDSTSQISIHEGDAGRPSMGIEATGSVANEYRLVADHRGDTSLQANGDMRRHTELASNPETHKGLNVKRNGINLMRAAMGLLGYLIIIVPILSLAAVHALNLSGAYFIPIASALGITGFYVTEKFACRNIELEEQ